MILFQFIKFNLQPARYYTQNVSQQITKVGFIGLGQMGSRMCNNLMKKGFDLTVYDNNKEVLKHVESKGLRAVDNVKTLTSSVDCVITMLPNGPDILALYTPDILKSIKPNSVVIDSSTTEHTVSQELENRFKTVNVSFIDAPVSGGVVGAENATLTFMVGGDVNTMKRAEPVLKAMGKNIYHCGKIGSGQIAKVCNNLVLGLTMAGLSEALTIGISLGLDAKVLTDIINVSTGQCWSSTVYNPIPGIMPNVPSSKQYEGGFSSQLIRKDLGIANKAAESIGLPLEIGKKTLEIYDQICKNGQNNKDFSIVYEFVKSKIKK